MFCPQRLFADPMAQPQSDNEHQWVSEAKGLIEELHRLIRATHDHNKLSSFSESLDHLEKADRILWKLWLVTGMPPQIHDTNRDLRRFLEQNTSAYQQYVTEKANLTSEDIHRLGLTNSIASFGSPLWYMTLKYLKKNTGLVTEWHIEIFTTPKRFMVTEPLSKRSYRRLSAAMSRWLTANRERLVWNPKTQRFHAKDGEYIETDGLFSTIVTEASPPDIAAGKRGGEEDTNNRR